MSGVNKKKLVEYVESLANPKKDKLVREEKSSTTLPIHIALDALWTQHDLDEAGFTKEE